MFTAQQFALVVLACTACSGRTLEVGSNDAAPTSPKPGGGVETPTPAPVVPVSTGATSAGAAPGNVGGSGQGQVLYTQCNMLGELDCSAADPKIRVLCDGMTWNPIGFCTGEQLCDTQPGPNHGLCTGPDAGASSHSGAPPNDAGSAGVVLYTQCSTLGSVDCSIDDPKVQVLCDGMTWNPIGTCSGQLVCDPLPGPDQGLCKAP